jgi:hypothetical protein
MLTLTINLLASARPSSGAAGQGRCTPAAGGGGRRALTGVGKDNCEVPLPAGDDVDVRAEATMLRTAGWRQRRSPGGRGARRGRGGWRGGRHEVYGD